MDNRTWGVRMLDNFVDLIEAPFKRGKKLSKINRSGFSRYGSYRGSGGYSTSSFSPPKKSKKKNDLAIKQAKESMRYYNPDKFRF